MYSYCTLYSIRKCSNMYGVSRDYNFFYSQQIKYQRNVEV